MVEYLELLENPANYYKRQRSVMRKAAKLREQGLSPSEALSEAWHGNPVSPATFQPSTFTWLLLAAGGFTLIWYLVKKEWWWKSIGRPKKLKAVIPASPYRNHAEESVSLIIPLKGGRSEKQF